MSGANNKRVGEDSSFFKYWSLHTKSLRCQLRTLLNSKILQIVTFVLKDYRNDFVVGTVLVIPIKQLRILNNEFWRSTALQFPDP